jgi:hypothetical protein
MSSPDVLHQCIKDSNSDSRRLRSLCYKAEEKNNNITLWSHDSVPRVPIEMIMKKATAHQIKIPDPMHVASPQNYFFVNNCRIYKYKERKRGPQGGKKAPHPLPTHHAALSPLLWPRR